MKIVPTRIAGTEGCRFIGFDFKGDYDLINLPI